MRKTIWKYILTHGINKVEMPVGAEVLSAQSQLNNPRLWALVDPDERTEHRFFEVLMTGEDVPCGMGIDRRYVGTYQLYDGELVYHVFERID